MTSRIDIIGQNGNDGLHYAEAPAEGRGFQVGGDHYTNLAIQPWDIMRANFSPIEFQAFLLGNVLKYTLRTKGERLEDLRKARHYLDVLISDIERLHRVQP